MLRVASSIASDFISSCHSGLLLHTSITFWHALNASGFLYSNSEEALYCSSLFQTRLNVTRLQPCLDRSEKIASPYSSQKRTQSIRWASLLNVSMLKVLRGVSVSFIWSTHTFIETTTMLRLQRVNTWCDGKNGAGGEVGFSLWAP